MSFGHQLEPLMIWPPVGATGDFGHELEPLFSSLWTWSCVPFRSSHHREDPFDLANEAWLFGGTLPMYIYVYIFIIPRAAAREFFLLSAWIKQFFPFRISTCGAEGCCLLDV